MRTADKHEKEVKELLCGCLLIILVITGDCYI